MLDIIKFLKNSNLAKIRSDKNLKWFYFLQWILYIILVFFKENRSLFSYLSLYGVLKFAMIIAIVDIRTHDIYFSDIIIFLIFEFLYFFTNKNFYFDRIIYAFCLFILFYVIYFFTNAMGAGDVYLGFAVGLMANDFYDVILIFKRSFVIAAIVSLSLILFKKKTTNDYIAFAPYIIISGLIVL